MRWIEWGQGLSAGNRKVEIRTVRVEDETGRARRLRATTCWDPARPGHTSTPAEGRLIREGSGRIGVLVSGRHQGHLRVGSRGPCLRSVSVPLDAISRKALRRLLAGTGLELATEGEWLFARDSRAAES